jgi:hypothetical protein
MKFLETTTNTRLMRLSIATLSTVLFKRGFQNWFLQGPKQASRHVGNMIGQALLSRDVQAREDLGGIESFNDRRHAQRVAIKACAAGHVLVRDSRGHASVVPTAACDQTIYEDWVAIQMNDGVGLFGTYPLTDGAQRTAFAQWRASKLANYPHASQVQ